MIGICALFFGAIFLLSCVSLPLLSEIEDYSDTITAFRRYSFIPEVGYNSPSVEGFVSIIDLPFDYVSLFSGEYTQAVYGGEELLLRRDGALFYAPKSVFSAELAFDRYMFTDGEKCGVKTIFGETLVPAVYREAAIYKRFILAKRIDGKSDIYDGKTLILSGVSENVALYTDDIFLYGGKLCDSRLSPLTVSEYEVLSDFENGARMIADANGFVGFDLGLSLIIPRFSEAGAFNQYGYAYAVENGKYQIIDKTGKAVIVEDADGRKPLGYDGTRIIYQEDDLFILTDSRAKFVNLMSFAPQNGCLIERGYDGIFRIYSITEDKFYPYQFAAAEAAGEYFLCMDESGRYSLLDCGGVPVLFDCDFIGFDGKTLLVEKERKIHVYQKEGIA